MKTILIGLAVGALIGGLLGNTRSCETGGCPLTATPFRGALWGGLLGVLFAFSLTANTGSGTIAAENAPELYSVSTPVASEAELDAHLQAGKETSVILFHASWCGACTAFKPTYSTVAGELKETVDFYTVDTDAASALAGRYKIRALPTTLVLSGGTETKRIVGSVGKAELVASIPDTLPPATETPGAEEPTPEKEEKTTSGQEPDGTV